MRISDIISYLREYDGPEIKLMEVCGTHTQAVFRGGIRSLISPSIKLISGPGCPVCVTPAAYIDKCVEYAKKPGHRLLTFGDMMKVPGRGGSISDNMGEGISVDLMYSPFEAIAKAKADPETVFVIAAVGFETTAPVYGLLVRKALEEGLENIRLVTALKRMIPALEWICESGEDISAFICPGHVSTIIGSRPYVPLAEKYGKPFVVSGFETEEILAVIYNIVRQLETGRHDTVNLYRGAVKDEGNVKAQELLAECFREGTAVWRGLGPIKDSGLYLKGRYEKFDGGSEGLDSDM